MTCSTHFLTVYYYFMITSFAKTVLTLISARPVKTRIKYSVLSVRSQSSAKIIDTTNTHDFAVDFTSPVLFHRQHVWTKPMCENWTLYTQLIFNRITCTQCIRCGLLLHMSHVAWSVCLSACLFVFWSHGCAVQKNGPSRGAVWGGGADSNVGPKNMH